MSSTWGKQFHISIFGESHGPAIGVTLDGVPAGLPIDREALHTFMQRRAPGKDATSTPRRELDVPLIQSGLYSDVTTGAPICAIIKNGDTHSSDYAQFASIARPGHSDYSGFLRYAGYNDVRGGGHFSGRLTAPLCFAGAVAKQLLSRAGISVGAHIARIAGISDTPFDPVHLDTQTLLRPGNSAFPVLNEQAGTEMRDAIESARMAQDSVGGVVECAAIGMPAGIGSPMFEGLENVIASLVFGIPAVKGLEFGDGFGASELRGSQNNDPFRICDKTVCTETNHAGGILGGISTGMPLLLRVAFKPTPSISLEQRTIDFVENQEKSIRIHGRHDPCVVVRAVPVVEAAVAIALLDALLDAKGYEGLRGEPAK